MRDLVRAKDWSATPLGPPDGWSEALRTTVETCLGSRFPVIIFWGDALVQIYNDAYAPILGAKHPQALGQEAAECFPEIWDVVGPMLNGVLATGEATWEDDFLLMLEREGFPEECYFTFSYSPAGAFPPEGVFCAVIETTRRVLGERRLEALRDLSESLAEARRVDEALEIAAAVLARHPSDLPAGVLCETSDLGCSYTWSPEGNPAHLDALKELVAGLPGEDSSGGMPGSAVRDESGRSVGRQRFERFSIDRLGSGRPSVELAVALNACVQYDDSYRSFLGLVAAAISRGVATAEAHEDAKRHAQALEELDRAKSSFLSNISHEFRTPLALILGPVEDYANDHTLPDEVRTGLAMAQRNGHRLLKLVNSLLDVARLEAGRATPAFEPTDLARFTVDLVSVFQSAAEMAGLQLVIDCSPSSDLIAVDREMWEQVVTNLCANAIKFTPAGSVTVRLTPIGDSVRLQVEDTGIGIAAEEVPFVFDQFRRAASRGSRTQEGTGLGLAIVRELVGLHGGAVSVESTPGAGSIFTVTIPKSRPVPARDLIPRSSRPGNELSVAAADIVREVEGLVAGAAHTGHTPLTPSGTGSPTTARTIYVVDDNADMRSYVGELLSRHWNVTTFGDPLRALSAIRTHTPDLVLSDVMMPELDGLSLVSEIRANPATASIPIILLSARAGEESTLEGLGVGADDYLVKPFNSRTLIARVRSHLDLAQLRQDLAQRTVRHHEQLAALATAASEIGDAESVDAIAVITKGTASQITGVAVTLRHIPGSVGRSTPELTDSPVDAASIIMELDESASPPRLTIHPVLTPGELLPSEQQALLAELARVATRRIESVVRLQREHHVSHTLQRGLLPRSLPTVAGLQLAARYRSATEAEEVGGDWYDAVCLPDGRLMVSVGDVLGHDLEAAVTMGEVRHFLRACAPDSDDPGALCRSVNKLLHTAGTEQIATAVVAFISPESGLMTVVNAGHPPALLLHPEGEPASLDVHPYPPLGAFEDVTYQSATVALLPGATLLFYSDGLVERRDEALDASIRGLVALASSNQTLGLETMLDRLLEGASESQRNRDDIVVLAVRRSPAGSQDPE